MLKEGNTELRDPSRHTTQLHIPGTFVSFGIFDPKQHSNQLAQGLVTQRRVISRSSNRSKVRLSGADFTLAELGLGEVVSNIATHVVTQWGGFKK